MVCISLIVLQARASFANIAKGPGVLVPRHHQYDVPRHQNNADAFGAFQVRIHQGDRLHSHADSRGSADSSAAVRLCRQAVQDQHEDAGSFSSVILVASESLMLRVASSPVLSHHQPHEIYISNSGVDSGS